MKANRKLILIGIIIIIIFICWLVTPLLSQYALKNIFDVKNVSEIGPQNVGNLGDLFGSFNALFTGLAFAGVVYTIYMQHQELKLTIERLDESLKETRSERQMSFALSQFGIMNKNEMVDARIKLYEIYKEDISPKQINNEIKQLLNYLNTIGYLLANKHLPEYPTLEMIYVQVIRVWQILGEHILLQRKLRGVYLVHLEWLASECFKYWLTVHTNSKITIPTKNTEMNTEIKQRSIEISDDTKAYLTSIKNAPKEKSDQLLS